MKLDELKTFDDDINDAFPDDLEPLTDHPLTEARLCAIQAFFQSRMDDEKKLKDIQLEFIHYRLKPRKADKKVFVTLVENLTDDENVGRYEEVLKAHTNERWDYERVGLVEKSILMTALAELYARPDTPVKVIINEYVDISKGYLKPKETSFIHAVVDAVAKKVKA